MAKYIFKSNGHAAEYFNGKRWVQPDFGNIIRTDDDDEAEALSGCYGLSLVDGDSVLSDSTAQEVENALQSAQSGDAAAGTAAVNTGDMDTGNGGSDSGGAPVDAAAGTAAAAAGGVVAGFKSPFQGVTR